MLGLQLEEGLRTFVFFVKTFSTSVYAFGLVMSFCVLLGELFDRDNMTAGWHLQPPLLA